MERTRWGRRTSQVGGKGRKQILVAFGIQGFLRSKHRFDFTQNNIKRRATCRWTGTGGEGVLGPCSEVADSPLATWNPHPIGVLLLMSLVTCTHKDHLRFLDQFEHLFGHCSETTFFWMVCSSLMAQYPSLDRVTGWKPPLKRSWSCTKVSKVCLLYTSPSPRD